MAPTNWSWWKWAIIAFICVILSAGAYLLHESISPIASFAVSLLSLVLSIMVLLIAKRVEDHIIIKVEIYSFKRLYESFSRTKDITSVIPNYEKAEARKKLNAILSNLDTKNSQLYKLINACIQLGLAPKSTYETFFEMLQKVMDYINECKI